MNEPTDPMREPVADVVDRLAVDRLMEPCLICDARPTLVRWSGQVPVAVGHHPEDCPLRDED